MDVSQLNSAGEMLPDPNNALLITLLVTTVLLWVFLVGLIMCAAQKFASLESRIENHYMTLPIYDSSTGTVTKTTVHAHAFLVATVQLLQKLTHSTTVHVALPNTEEFTEARAFLHEIVDTETSVTQAYTEKPLVSME